MAATRRRTIVINLVLVGVLVAGLAAGAAALGGGPTPDASPQTATVERGTVIATVAASGEVAAPRDASLDFAVPGRVVEVAVDTGDRVEEGQVLARLEDEAFVEQVEVAAASVRAAEAGLGQLQAGPTDAQQRLADLQREQAALQVAQAEAALALAEQQREVALDDLDAQVDAAEGGRDRADTFEELSVEQAEAQLDQAEEALELAEDQRDITHNVLGQQVDAAEGALSRAEDLRDDACNPDPTVAECAEAEAAVQEAEASLAAAELAEEQGRAREAQTIQQARDAVDQAEAALELAEAQRDGTLDEMDEQVAAALRGRAAGQVGESMSLQQAEDQLEQARLGLEIARAQAEVETAPPRDGDLAQAEAQLVQAEAELARAERDLDDAVLRAPTDGVVAAVTVQVGDTVAGGPGPEGAAVTLTGTADREVTARFSEADATRLESGQPAVVTFDALPDVALNGRVERVDLTPTVTGNLVQYGAQVAADGMPEDVRIGQTSTVEVLVGEADDALYVPTTALTTVGAETTVTVFDGEEEATRAVEVGLRGDQHTEIVTGLDEGEEVVLPTRSDAEQFDPFGPPPQEQSAPDPGANHAARG